MGVSLIFEVLSLLFIHILANEEQSISPIKCDKSPVEVVFLIDITAANKTNFKVQQQRVLRTLKHLEAAVVPRKQRFSVIAFHSNPVTLMELGSPFSSDTNRVATVIGKLHPRIHVQTSVAKAFDAATEQFRTYGELHARRIILLAHDGVNTDFVAETVTAGTAINDLGVHVFALSGNPLSNFLALLGYTGDRERLLVDADDTQEFHAMMDDAIGVCGKARVFSRKAKGVRLGRAEGKPKFFEESQDCGHNKVDLMLVMDTSGSVYEVFEDQRKVALEILESFPNDTYTERLQVSVVRFAATAEILIPFLKGRNKEEMLKEIENIKFTGQNTRIASAIDISIDELERSRRKDATQVFVLISDGHGQEYWNVVQMTGKRLQETGAEIFAVSAGRDYNNAELLIYVGHKSRLFIGPRYTGFVPLLASYIGKCVGAPSLLGKGKHEETKENANLIEKFPSTKPRLITSDFIPSTTITTPIPSIAFTTSSSPSLTTIDTVNGLLSGSKGSTSLNEVEGSGDIEGSGEEERTTLTENVTLKPNEELSVGKKEIQVQPSEKSLENLKLRDLSSEISLICDVDLIMILDRSTSVTDDFEREISTSLKVANIFTDQDYSTSKIRIGAVSFASDARLELPLMGHDRNQVLETIQKIEHTGGSTSAVEGAKLAMTRLLSNRRKKARLVILLLTDGHSQDYWKHLVETSMKLRDNPNSVLLAYTASNYFSRSELQAWAGNKKNVFLDNEQNLFFDVLKENFKKCSEVDEDKKDGFPEEKIELFSTTTVPPSTTRATEQTEENPATVATELATEADTTTEMTSSEFLTTISAEQTPQEIEKRKDNDQENLVELGAEIAKIEQEQMSTPFPNLTITGLTAQEEIRKVLEKIESNSTADIPEDEERLVKVVGKILSTTQQPPTTEEPKLHGIKTAEEISDKDSSGLAEKVHSGSCLVDLLFVIDVSTSVEAEFQQQLQFAVDLVKRLPSEDFEKRVHVGAVVFNWNATLRLKLGQISSRSELLDSLLSIENTGGSTSLATGFNLAIREIEQRRRPNARQTLVLVSDGNSQDLWDDVVRTSNKLRTIGADVYAVTVSKKYMFRELELYAGDKWRVYIDARIRQFLDEAEQFLLHCGTSSLPKEQLTAIPIKNLPSCDADPVDMILAIDTTSSGEKFFEERQFAEDLVKSLPVLLFEKRLSLSIIPFDKSAEMATQLGSSISRDDIIYELERIQNTHNGPSNFSSLVRAMSEEILARRRPNSRIIVVLITGKGGTEGLQEVQEKFDVFGQMEAEVFAVATAEKTEKKEKKNFFSSAKLDQFVQEVGQAITKCVERKEKPVKVEGLKSISNRAGLNPGLIKLKDSENQVKPTITEEEELDPSCKYKKIDLQLILDASTSREEVFEQQRELALSLIEKLPISADGAHVAVGINSFTSIPTLRQTLGLGRDKKMVRSAIENIAYNGGSTLTAQAVDLSVDDLLRGRRKDAIQVVILMNDGISQDSWERVVEASKRLESTGAERFGVALGDVVDLRELELYIGKKNRLYRSGEKETERLLNDVVALLQKECNSIDSTETSIRNEKEEISLVDCAHPNLDLLVLFDNTDKSGNMSDPIVNANRYLILDVLGSLANTSHVRVSVISFSKTPKVELDFTNVSERDRVFAKVEAIKAIGGMPSYADAITTGLDHLELHRRPDAKTTMIIVGDGVTKDPSHYTVGVSKRIRETPRLSCLAVDSSPKTDIRTLKRFTGRREHVFDYERNALFAEEVKRMAKKPNLRNCPQLAILDVGKRALAARVINLDDDKSGQKDEVYSTIGPLTQKEELKLSQAIDDVKRDLGSVALESAKFVDEKIIVPKTTEKPTLRTTESTTLKTTVSTEPTTPPSFVRYFQTRSTEPPPERPTTFKPGCLMDVMMVLDSSGSVEETFRREKELAAGIIDLFRIGPDNARVSIIKFAAELKVKTVYSFNDVQSRLKVLKTLENIPFSSGTTAIHSAILRAVKEYSEKRGARPGKALPIAILFTDGFGQQSAEHEAQILRELIPHTYAVAINHQYPISRPELIRITGDEKRVYTDKNIEDLHRELKSLTTDCILE